jgi:1-acyl-sn-glycerol-3-phosphate acyltransferase
VSDFDLPPSIPRTRGVILRTLARWLLSWRGWRTEGALPDEPKLVAIVAPHTSNWDFPLGLLVKWALGLRVSFLGKHTLFRPPLGWIMRRWGGIPVDRRAANNVVSQMVDEFARRDALLLVIAPEGTRKHVAEWKTGFYHIAHGARVPIVCVAFDWGRKVIRFGPTLVASGDAQREVGALRDSYDGVRGKRAV